LAYSGKSSAQNPSLAHPHVADIYGKDGSAYGYQAKIAAIDEYDIAVVVLTAGNALAVMPIYNAVLASLVPLLTKWRGNRWLRRGCVGTSVDDAVGNDDDDGEESGKEKERGVAFNVTIAQDLDSLFLAGLERSGTDILESLHEIWALTLGAYVAITPVKAWIFPVEIQNEDTIARAKEKKVICKDWRID